MTIGENIHRIRTSKGLTLEEVGKACKVGRQTIHKYENGTVKNIPKDKIEAMAKLFKVSPIEIIGWTENPLDALIEQITHEYTLQDKLAEETEDFSDEELALVIEYAQFIRGRRKKNGK